MNSNLSSTIDEVRSLIDIPKITNLHLIKNVVVILTSSRSGSSVFKEALSCHPDIMSLSGEEEPFYILTKNGFPFSSDYDGFDEIIDKAALGSYFLSDLQVNEPIDDIEDHIDHWSTRLPLQILQRVSRNLISDLFVPDPKVFLRSLLGEHTCRLYDVVPERVPFTQPIKIEEPPFVIIKPKRRATLQDLSSKILLLKTPQDSYRTTIFKKLFPNANIRYIHLTRGIAQTINGLIDGWLCNYGFFAHNMSLLNIPLDIKGYSGHWWKFDLPPEWQTLATSASLPEVCAYQWQCAHEAILESSLPTKQVKFEKFLQDPYKEMSEITNWLGIPEFNFSLPLTMTTEQPRPFRWMNRSSEILEQVYKPKNAEIMKALNYSMKYETWA